MLYVGVDGCKSGWFAIALDDGDGYRASVYSDINALWNENRDASVILIDIPIGLRESGSRERECDLEARRYLGPGRASSVFPAPCRQALNASSSEVSRINKEITGRGLSLQSISIIPRIAQVDSLLANDIDARRKIMEIHPEVCFWAFNRKKPMAFPKRKKEGFRERLELLERAYPGCRAVVEDIFKKYKKDDAQRDDILDAFVGALTAKLGYGNYQSLPEIPEKDSKGLQMQMIYYEICHSATHQSLDNIV